jgi:hypothetical protein
MLVGWIWRMGSFSDSAVTWLDASGEFRLPGHRPILRSVSKPGEELPYSFERVIVMLVAGSAFCYGESNKLT